MLGARTRARWPPVANGLPRTVRRRGEAEARCSEAVKKGLLGSPGTAPGTFSPMHHLLWYPPPGPPVRGRAEQQPQLVGHVSAVDRKIALERRGREVLTHVGVEVVGPLAEELPAVSREARLRLGRERVERESRSRERERETEGKRGGPGYSNEPTTGWGACVHGGIPPEGL